MWLYTVVAPADFDGDGRSDRTVFRASNGVWYSMFAGGNSLATVFGSSGDLQAAADFDGDGKADIATVSNQGSMVWRILRSSDQTMHELHWGASIDTLMVGDVDGDGKADQVAWRALPGGAIWYVKRSSGGISAAEWGVEGDLPLLGDDVPMGADVDGDGFSDLTLWRPSNGVWYTRRSGGGTATVQWGVDGDQPVGRAPGS